MSWTLKQGQVIASKHMGENTIFTADIKHHTYSKLDVQNEHIKVVSQFSPSGRGAMIRRTEAESKNEQVYLL